MALQSVARAALFCALSTPFIIVAGPASAAKEIGRTSGAADASPAELHAQIVEAVEAHCGDVGAKPLFPRRLRMEKCIKPSVDNTIKEAGRADLSEYFASLSNSEKYSSN
ncbi:MAG: hypothetical protein AAGC95_05140 [Pseudomonadota bacterium]